MNEAEKGIQWAPRVKQALIRRLYEMDARGIQDEELIDDIGWRLYERCLSFIAAVEAVHGRARCPGCGSIITHDCQPETVLHCAQCGWETTWAAYFRTIQHKQLSGNEVIVAFFQDFVDRFPGAQTPREKMALIDLLIHRFHWNIRYQGNTRAAGVNLIEGNYHEVVEFLDHLSCGEGSTPGVRETWKEWRDQINITADLWQDERLRRTDQ